MSPREHGISRRRFVSATAGATLLAAIGGPRTAKAWAEAPAAGAAATATTGSWTGVRIGGGGFVDGIVFNQSRAGLLYARTDIGGAYRWDPAAGSWVPLLDWVGFDDWGYNGVVSLASDPVAPDNLYAAVGMYTNSWDPNNGAVLRSADQGATWAVSPLPFKLGGNMPGRGMGERLAVDPNDNRILYLGAPSGHGLWRSTDSGATWSKVSSFPNPGTYVADPSDTTGYQSDLQGVVWVVFDPSTGSPGKPTQDVYVGVADLANTVYRSTDGGSTWAAVPGAPTGFIAHKGVLDPVNHLLYLATSDTGGPYDGSSGDVWKFGTQSGSWTRISPVPSTDTDNDYFGYSGLTIDRQHPGTLMVATQVSWWPDIIIFRSTDSGAHWTRIWDYTSYPDRSLRYTLDASAEPWLTFGEAPAPPVPSPKLGWMTEAMEIDPFDSDRMLYGTGATLYATTDLTRWDAGGTITLAPMVAGLEETAVNDLISPPAGAPLLSALGDIGGFRHDDLAAVPALMYTAPNLTTTTSLDYAELAPAVIVRAGNIDRSGNPNVNRAGFSSDGGADWWQAGSEPGGVTGGGTIAVAADGSAAVWAPAGASVSRSTDSGSSWTASSGGVPSGAVVRSDRVNPKKFYAFSGGTFYRSTDGGASFAATATAASGLPSSGTVAFRALPGREGDIWLAGGSSSGNAYGLWHSTDSGATFGRVAGVDEADNIGAGMPAPGGSGYPALYLIGKVAGVRGVFRSDDAGATWPRVNDDRHQYGAIGAAITGDPRVYGRVYLGTNGRGILYCDTAGSGGGTGGTGGGTPPPATGTVRVQYRDYATDPTTNQIRPGLQLVNTGSRPLPLSAVTLRYWFTADAGASTFSTYVDYAALGASNISSRVVAMAAARPGADHYLEVSFGSAAGSLAPGASTGEIQNRFNKTDWSAFDQADDYSYAAGGTAYADTAKVTAYVGGALGWGTEPA
ncbi:cellulose binding domain-containing protein [Phaeacidiphilus oryzae]|uniref:cellulose binding domain-containing protein n=1 Tax=Phaeacidiphilus oryzae TaxID=348818 RepID=UPI0009FEE33E|nr:cellulose binding domain-containing protein [Phaeacidiphilus oryzae]